MPQSQGSKELPPEERKNLQKLVCRTETSVITEVTEGEDSYFIETNTGDGFGGMLKSFNIVPKVGQEVKMYFYRGWNVRGVDLDGQELFFKTDAEFEAEHQRESKKLTEEKEMRRQEFDKELADPNSDFNRRLGTLPKVFKQRFKKFFRLGESFWEHAWYELVSCEIAFKVAYACRSQWGIRKFYGMSLEEQKEMIPGLGGFSENRFYFAYHMACIYLRDSKNVLRVHGALSPLVGSKPYIGR